MSEIHGGMRLFTRHAIGGIAASVFIGAIAWLAQATGVSYILFPELGALAHDIFTRPRGAWATAPFMLVFTPVATAAYGTLVARSMDYGLVSVLLTVGGAMLIIRLLRSPIAPAISAALLPLSLGVTSWWYPPAILVGTGLLACLAVLRNRFYPVPPEEVPISDLVEDMIELPPADYSWTPFFLAFLTADALLAETVGWHFLLYPPLVVIGFEMFAHSQVCPWADRPLSLPAACMATGAIGVGIVTLLGPEPFSVLLSMACGIMVLHLFDLHVPPALAIGLLPFVIDHPNGQFFIAVGIGTALLTASFLVWSRIFARRNSVVIPDE